MFFRSYSLPDLPPEGGPVVTVGAGVVNLHQQAYADNPGAQFCRMGRTAMRLPWGGGGS